MACASQAMISANTCTLTSPRLFKKYTNGNKRNLKLFTVRASSDDTECNTEECAPEKEVGKVSMEWLAGEKTKVVGTFPPSKRGWTGYVEKDTAGQTNIYSVEPAVYVAESALSSGSAGTSADGSEGTAARAAGLGLISVAAASLILLLVGKNPSNNITTAEYKGPSLSYYINKFKPGEIIQAAVPSQTEPPSSIQADSSMPEVPEIEVQSAPDVSEVPVQSRSEPEPLTSSVSSASLAN
ncbi:PROTEIN MAINTENANCE OF PSII UNDER HIGH LIGHT 1 [Salix viminalis]|uniref:PROTEIN MAINTENANCE OF PSII UNDER HIGH LIGHT 1 n=1 Tax=Salix viminalis TaxID=40686 RepID=A0A6N2JW87_SALVM|nr:PROTEIN MAINTENANCE OF PSII UNDER HIGH LIGHT 1 [Salix viminalis]